MPVAIFNKLRREGIIEESFKDSSEDFFESSFVKSVCTYKTL